MSMKESALYNGLNRGGCSLMGEDISPTMISGIYKQNGTTQDKLNVITYRKMGHPQNSQQGQGWEPTMVMEDNMEEQNQMVVRRLTPLECERLQGYPDGWTDIGEWTDSKGKKHKDADSPRYKALGNSIALPFWEWMAERMVAHLDTDHPTMASLFDGIGGFPLVFSRCGCEPVWASEIEEFPIAVTKIRFPDKEDTKCDGNE